MSRYVGKSTAGHIITAAQRWRERCLYNGNSVLSDKHLWTLENIEALEQYFVNNLDEGKGDFFTKLENQLAPTSPEVKQLAAEMMWLMLLCPRNITPGKKLESIQKIWSWAGEPLDTSQTFLTEENLVGIGSAGTSFNTNRWRELVYVINVCKRLISQSLEQQKDLFNEGWEFAKWLEQVEGTESRQFRHMLLYMLFPDQFECIFGGTDRRKIATVFSGWTSRQISNLTALELDKKLHEIRTEQERDLGSSELDFYEPPLFELWRDRPPKHWLFTWNPNLWSWNSLSENMAKLRRGVPVIDRWGCTNRQARPGDRAWLVRLGQAPKGIMAVGNVMSEPYEDTHWNKEKAEEVETCWFVDIQFSQILDVYKDKFITEQDLNSITVDNQKWWPQSTGIEIKQKSAALIEQLWKKVTAQDKPAQQLVQEVAEPVNRIYYGPPGTGKTYTLNEIKKEYSSKAQSISREQWLSEQLESVRWFDVVFLALYALGGRAKVGDIAKHEYVVQKAKAIGRTQNIIQQIWASLQSHTLEESETVKYSKRHSPCIFDKDKSSFWSLQGNWEEECEDLLSLADVLKKGQANGQQALRYEFVTFHQAYGYEDFVEGIRPVQDEDSDEMVYRVEPGVFRRICRRAELDQGNRYAIFIDEINRGNVAKIFGELITLIEPDKRCLPMEFDPDSGMRVTLPYSKEPFGVPKNLDIYGTMNTADRSIALLDTALRRRFQFQELMPDHQKISGPRGDGYIEDGEGGIISLRDLLAAMNLRIRFLLNRDLMLGHAYLMEVRNFHDLKMVILNKFVPLLQEYFYGDWHKMQLVFCDVNAIGKPLEPQIIVHETLESAQILGFEHDDFEDLIDYRVANSDEITPDAIRKIYEPANG